MQTTKQKESMLNRMAERLASRGVTVLKGHTFFPYFSERTLVTPIAIFNHLKIDPNDKPSSMKLKLFKLLVEMRDELNRQISILRKEIKND